ncbi:hypothetical protein N9H39_06530 [Gammaproteobacteria bacterium]|jgi:hypothetical protein|nr:hypothetical protein [Gammaproteobacteria bacterium]
MKSRTLSLLAVIVIFSVFSVNTWACSAMGPTTHAGKILSFNEGERTFTLLDMETMKPITFSADDAIMQKIANAQGMAIVDFSSEGAGLTATRVEIQ